MNEIVPSKSKVQIWQERITVQAQSGQSIRIFCEENRISHHTFQYWKRKFCDLKHKYSSGQFIALANKTHSIFSSPRIHLPNGVKIELGGSLESVVVNQFLQKLCGVGHPPKDGHSAKS